VVTSAQQGGVLGSLPRTLARLGGRVRSGMRMVGFSYGSNAGGTAPVAVNQPAVGIRAQVYRGSCGR
jgi:hypothetical protein